MNMYRSKRVMLLHQLHVHQLPCSGTVLLLSHMEASEKRGARRSP